MTDRTSNPAIFPEGYSLSERLRGIALTLDPIRADILRLAARLLEPGSPDETTGERPDPGHAPESWPEGSAERIRERMRQATIKNQEQVHVLRGDMDKLFRWISLRNGTKRMQPEEPRETAEPQLMDRANGVHGVYCIGRVRNGTTEYWTGATWAAFCGDLYFDLRPAVEPSRRICAVEGCRSTAREGGAVCEAHYELASRHESARDAVKAGGEQWCIHLVKYSECQYGCTPSNGEDEHGS